MRVDNEALRHAAQRSGLTNSEIARRAGWMKPDTTRVRYALGMREVPGSNGKPYSSTTIDYDAAVALCHAIGCDPVEVGL